jgi:hypothetical protein
MGFQSTRMIAGENVTLKRQSRTPVPDNLIWSEQPEVAEGLFNRRDLVWWAEILLGCIPWCGKAKLLFAVCNPGALGHKAVLPHYPFLDFLVRDAWRRRFMLSGLTRAPMSSFFVSTAHAGLISSLLQSKQAAKDLKPHLLFLLELAVVLSHESFDFTGHGEEFFPLLLIESDWESSESVH